MNKMTAALKQDDTFGAVLYTVIANLAKPSKKVDLQTQFKYLDIFLSNLD